MDLERAIKAFDALSQETRLKVFKILIEYGKSGTSAGTISDRLSIPHNTLSFHLSHLTQAGLISARKDGRSMIYAANVNSIESLINYLRENCCINEEGEKSLCATTESEC
ncbi:MAG: metalloregulator ArsR/SmtB family transcription factor [Verrucomicrobiota bacterium]